MNGRRGRGAPTGAMRCRDDQDRLCVCVYCRSIAPWWDVSASDPAPLPPPPPPLPPVRVLDEVEEAMEDLGRD